MSYEARRILTPRKRKEVDTSAQPLVQVTSVNQAPTAESTSNRLLAGYMAYEFLTKGSLFGQKFEPVEPKRNRSGTDNSGYADVANIMKSDAVHIPGLVNPTQLARWIQM